MKFRRDGSRIFIRLETGEEVHSSLAEIARREGVSGGWFSGMFQSSRPGWPSSVLLSDQLAPPSRLSNTPAASAPASTRPCAADSPDTFESFRSASSP